MSKELENENLQETPDTAQENVQEVETQQEQQQEPKVFTQDEVNEIVRRRLEKNSNRIFGRYGAKTRQELDDLFEKIKDYDAMKDEYEKTKRINRDLTEKTIFLDNNLNMDKKDDILTYFKGKELDFTDENVKSLLASHPEWSKKEVATIKTIGVDQSKKQSGIDEKDLAAKLFGFKKFA